MTVCTERIHRCGIDEFCENIINACINAGEVFPKIKARKRMPYWGSRVKDKKDEAMFWQSLWKDCGKPSSGIVYELKKKTKLQYHYAVRKLKKNSESLRKKRMAEALLVNNHRDFWNEVKKVSGNKIAASTNICGKTNVFDIATIFAEKYKYLYNSVPSSKKFMQKLKHKIKEISNDANFTTMMVSEMDILKAMKHLKHDKSDDNGALFSSHILYASYRLYKYIADLFNVMTVHGYIPVCLLNSNIISIPKDCRGDLCSDDNYRGISLCSSLMKLYELLLIQKQGDKLITSDMQFAYKAGHSTTMCTSVLKEVVNNFLYKGSNVYCCFIDASKAFDRIKHDILFEILMERNVNPLMVKILINLYERQTAQTSWLGSKSEKFSCTNGVRQGGILSPLLYAIYNDILLERLKKNGSGCWIGDRFFGALSYADDLCILSPTLSGLQSMLNVCEIYGDVFDVKFNAKKTKCMKFSKCGTNFINNIDIRLCGQKLTWVDEFKYLGNWITPDLSENLEITRKLGVFYGGVNNLCSTFKNIGTKHTLKLFYSYCCHFYGSQAWRLRDKNINRIFTAWNKSVRHICKLPPTTHTYYLSYIIGQLHISDDICLRTRKMILTMLNSENDSVSFLTRSNINNYNSLLGDNWNFIKKQLNIHDDSENPKLVLMKRKNELYTPECGLVMELLDVIDDSAHILQFNKDEIADMLYYISTS
jgi:hypothetical protein